MSKHSINQMKLVCLVVMIWLSAVSNTFAQIHFGPELKIGEQAPKLSVYRWLKGDSIRTFEKDKLYVLNFTGTWCSPCMSFLPTLSAIAGKYSERVKISSVLMQENNSTKRDTTNVRYVLQVIKTLKRLQVYEMNFDVAVDGPAMTALRTWGGPEGIGPSTSFLIKEGKIAWKGATENVATLLEATLKGEDTALAGKRAEEEAQAIDLNVEALRTDSGKRAPALITKQIDSLVSRYGQRHPRLFLKKFEVLAPVDPARAYRWIDTLVSWDRKDIYWSVFIGNLCSLTKNINTDVVLRAIDYAKNREFDEQKLRNIELVRAGTYALMKNYQQSVKVCDDLLATVKEGPTLKLVPNLRALYEYARLRGISKSRASKFLKEYCGDNVNQWERMIYATETGTVDFLGREFTLLVADEAINAFDGEKKDLFMDRKAHNLFYFFNKDPDALAIYRTLLKHYQRRGLVKDAEEVAKKIALLTENPAKS